MKTINKIITGAFLVATLSLVAYTYSNKGLPINQCEHCLSTCNCPQNCDCNCAGKCDKNCSCNN